MQRHMMGWAQTVDALPFPEKIALLVDMHVVNRPKIDSLVPLTEALGCRTLEPNGRWHERPLDQPGDEYEDIVRTAMVQALVMHMSLGSEQEIAYDNVLSLADGLVKKERWRACLTSIDGAYALADALLRLSNGEFADSRDDIELGLCALFNEWLHPAEPWTTYPETSILICALFGSAWYELTLANEDLDVWDRLAIVHDARPRFAPGVLPENLMPDEVVLPSLGPG